MNIDKFGHHIHKRLRLSDLFDYSENSLRKTKNGEYNLYFTKLKGVRAPVEGDEVVNKEYLDHRIDEIYRKYDINLIMENFRKEIFTEIESLISNLKRDNIPKTLQFNTKQHSRSVLDKIDFIPE